MKKWKYEKINVDNLAGIIRVDGKFETYVYRKNSTTNTYNYVVYNKFTLNTIDDLKKYFHNIYNYEQICNKYNIHDRLISINDLKRICPDLVIKENKNNIEVIYDNLQYEKYQKCTKSYKEIITKHKKLEGVEYVK